MQPAPSSDSTSPVPEDERRRLRQGPALGAVICLALLGVAASCNKESPPTAEEPRAPVANGAAPTAAEPARSPEPSMAAPPDAPAAAVAPAAAGAAGKNRISEASFDLAIAAGQSHEAGKPSEASIVLDAKEPFHVNDKYPYKFKLKAAEGLTYPAEVVSKDRAKLEKMRVTVPIAFTPQKAGRHTVAGQFSFSVCTEDKCLIEKRELALDIDVK